MAQLAADPSCAESPELVAAWRELAAVRRLQWEKALKRRLESAVEQFNEDYKKGFQFMQARALVVSCFHAPDCARLDQAHSRLDGKHGKRSQSMRACRTASLLVRTAGLHWLQEHLDTHNTNGTPLCGCRSTACYQTPWTRPA